MTDFQAIMTSFQAIKESYQRNPLWVLKQLIPDGKVEGCDYVVKNPRRNDRRAGSFRINIATGRFNDFASGDHGGSIIDLVAFVRNCDIATATKKLEELLSFPSLASNKTSNSYSVAKRKKIDLVYIWGKSIKKDHEYLRKKQITIGNARVNDYKGVKNLVVPMTDSIPNDKSGLQIKCLQFIGENGSKRFSGQMKGLFHIASDYNYAQNMIIIAEGYATARSIAEAMGLYTVAAMSACNMKCIALRIRELLPKSRIIIAADKDEAGLKAATEAFCALGSNTQIIYPTQCNDFNDIFIEIGPDGLKIQLQEAIYGK
jgi:putative DNA primase/helicase